MLTPHLIARIFDRSVAARLRSSVDAVEPKGLLHSSGINVSGLHAKIFTDWLAGYWLPDGPTEPLRYPDAVSFWAPIQWSAVHAGTQRNASSWDFSQTRSPVAIGFRPRPPSPVPRVISDGRQTHWRSRGCEDAQDRSKSRRTWVPSL